jgi:adenylate cyclase
VGIGINTGIVAYGAIGSKKTLQYTVIGDAVNTANRLCSLAKPGEIICSEHTYRRAGGKIKAVELPRVRVKGKQEELTIFRVVGDNPSFNPKETTDPR